MGQDVIEQFENVVSLQHAKFNKLCNTVEDIEEAVVNLIAFVNTLNPKIRVGVVVKTLIACIHDGLVDEESLRIILGWLQSQHAEYQKQKGGC